jgi:hypothetical protein
MAKRRRSAVPAGLALATALAPGLSTAAPKPRGANETTHREGDYGGVEGDRSQPTDPSVKPKPRRVPPKGTLSWIGFEVKDGGSEVFFQSPAAFDLTQHVENGQLVIELGNLNQLGQNTWRPIDTHFFDNPLSRIEARRVGAARATKSAAAHGAGIEVRITFKTPGDAAEGTFRSSQESDGYYYAYLSFGASSGGSGGTASEPEK